MRLLIQRVSRASVEVQSETAGSIDRGFLVLCGFQKGDIKADLSRIALKCLNLRVFEDEQGKMNLSILDIAGELLVVSQFTLYANCKKGRRPSFDNSMNPEGAENFYNLLIEEFKQSKLKVASGIFGAKMNINLINDGPVTIMLDSNEI